MFCQSLSLLASVQLLALMKWIYGSMQMFCVNVNMQIYTVNIGNTAFKIWFQTESKSKQMVYIRFDL